MEDKARKLVMALETLALVTAAILILVDYKLKQDLMGLYQKLEAALNDAKKYFGEDYFAARDPGGVHTGDLVGNAPTVEEKPSDSQASQNGQPKPPARRRTPANRSGGNRDSAVSGPDNAVGP